MKLYVADYLGDTHHLGALEHGAYLLLLMAMWRAGGTLPAADANLSRLARCTAEEWAQIKDLVLPFFKHSRGRLTHKRLAAEMAKYENISGKRAEAGKQGGRPKANKYNGEDKAKAFGEESNCRHNQNQNHIDAADDSAGARFSDLDKSAIEGLTAELREAAGTSLNTASPKLLVIAPILALLRPGTGPAADLHADVLPAIRATAAKARPGQISHWGYFTPMIAEARDRRLSGAPEVSEVVPLRATGPPNFADKLAAEKAEARRLALAMMEAEDGRTNGNH